MPQVFTRHHENSESKPFTHLSLPKPFTGPYANAKELMAAFSEGIHYVIRTRRGVTNVAVLAIHGGSIEPGTTEMADAIAGEDHNFYSFVGLVPEPGCRDLHIKSTSFDEARALAIVESSDMTVSVHGCPGPEQVIYLGGLDEDLRRSTAESLNHAGFEAGEHSNKWIQGRKDTNICNRNQRGKGLQIELPQGLRELCLTNASILRRISEALRRALPDPSHEKYTFSRQVRKTILIPRV